MEANRKIQILLCSQQPFVARGFAAVVRGRPDFELVEVCASLPEALALIRTEHPAVLLLYLTSQICLSDLRAVRAAAGNSRVVLWGDGLAGEFAFQAMQLGVRGILPSTTPVDRLLISLQDVHGGALCFDRELIESVLLQKRVTLTKRQGQIVSLVAQGFKNKEIACALGLTEGTVKFYLYKLFRKLGMNDRLDMALYGLKNLFAGQPDVPRIPAVGRRGRRPPDSIGPRSLPPQTRERVRWHAIN